MAYYDTINDYKQIIDNYKGPVVTKELYDLSKDYQQNIPNAVKSYKDVINDLKPQALKKSIKTGLINAIPNYNKNIPIKGQLIGAIASNPEFAEKLQVPYLEEAGKVFKLGLFGSGKGISEWNLDSESADNFFDFLNSKKEDYVNEIKEIKEEIGNSYEKSLNGDTATKAQSFVNEYQNTEAELNKRLETIKNDDSVKEALNYKVNADGSYTESTKENFEKANEVIKKNREEFIKDRVAEVEKKIPMNTEFSSYTVDDIMNKGAEEKITLFGSIPEQARESLGINLDKVGDMNKEQIEKVLKGIQNKDYLKTAEAELGKIYDSAIGDNKKYSKIIRNGKATAEGVAEKMSSYKTAGKYALGALAGTALISALFFGSNKGEQTNAQLYGQQPLY